MHGQFCQYLILLLCNTSNACLYIDSTVLDRFLEMPKNSSLADVAVMTLAASNMVMLEMSAVECK